MHCNIYMDSKLKPKQTKINPPKTQRGWELSAYVKLVGALIADSSSYLPQNR